MTTERRQRRAARVVLIDERDRVLLLHGSDPARPEAGTWWFTTGGGIEPGETVEAAARREVLEETGHRLHDLGPVVHESVAEFEIGGVHYEQTQVFFVVRTDSFALDTAGWDELELASIAEHRWWPIEELRATTERVYPPNLLEIIDARRA